MFRLAMLTGFCYVNLPLVRFDRSPAEIRHVGVQSEWNKFEFWLRDSQLRLEGTLALERRPSQGNSQGHSGAVKHDPSAVDELVFGNRTVRKGARSCDEAAQLDLTFNVAAKWLLTWVSPRLALRTVQRRKEERRIFSGMK